MAESNSIVNVVNRMQAAENDVQDANVSLLEAMAMRQESAISETSQAQERVVEDYRRLAEAAEGVTEAARKMSEVARNEALNLGSELEGVGHRLETLKGLIGDLGQAKVSLVDPAEVSGLVDLLRATREAVDACNEAVSEGRFSAEAVGDVLQRGLDGLGDALDDASPRLEGMVSSLRDVEAQAAGAAAQAEGFGSGVETATSAVDELTAEVAESEEAITESMQRTAEGAQRVTEAAEASRASINLLTQEINASASSMNKARSTVEQFFQQFTAESSRKLLEGVTQTVDQVQTVLRDVNRRASEGELNTEAVSSGVNAVTAATATIEQKLKDLTEQANAADITVENRRRILEGVREFGKTEVDHLEKLARPLAELNRETGAYAGLLKDVVDNTAALKQAVDDAARSMNDQVLSDLERQAEETRQHFAALADPASLESKDARLGLGVDYAGQAQAVSGGIPQALSAAVDNLLYPTSRGSRMYEYFGGGFTTNGREAFAADLRDAQRTGTAVSAEMGKLMDQLKGARAEGSEAKVSAILSQLVELVIANAEAHKTAGRNLDLGSKWGSKLSPSDRAAVEGYLKSTQGATTALTDVIRAVEEVDPESGALDQLRRVNRELNGIRETAESTRDRSSSLVEGVNKILSAANSVGRFMSGAMNVMGLGRLVPSVGNFLGLASGSFQSYNDDGDRYYRLALAEASMGGTAGSSSQVGRARRAIVDEADKYFEMTGGMIGFNEVPQAYENLLRQVGGHYGESADKAAEDISKFNETTFSMRKVSGISDSTAAQALKTFYKDMGMSATEAAGVLVQMTQAAQTANVPIEKYVSTVTRLADSLRNYGMDGGDVTDIMNELVTVQNRRVEDAQSLVQGMANATQRMAGDWNQSAYWGMMTGQADDPFSAILQGELAFDEKGKVNEQYYEKMAERVIARNEFMSGLAGRGTDLSYAIMLEDFIKQGFTRKDAGTLTSEAMRGDRKALSALLKEFTKKRDAYEEALPEAAKAFDEQLKAAGDQLAETRKMTADLTLTEKRLGELIRDHLTEPLSKVREGFKSLLDNVVQEISGFLHTLNDLINGKERPSSDNDGVLAGVLKWFRDTDFGKLVDEAIDAGKQGIGLVGAAAGTAGIAAGGLWAYRNRKPIRGTPEYEEWRGSREGRSGESGGSRSRGRGRAGTLLALLAGAGLTTALGHVFSPNRAAAATPEEKDSDVERTILDLFTTGKAKASVRVEGAAGIPAAPGGSFTADDGFDAADAELAGGAVSPAPAPGNPPRPVGGGESLIGLGTIASAGVFGLADYGVARATGDPLLSMRRSTSLADLKGVAKTGLKGNAITAGLFSGLFEFMDYQQNPDKFTAGERLARAGIDTLTYGIGGLAGGALGSLAGPVGTFVGAAAGGELLNRTLGVKAKELFGISDDRVGTAADRHKSATAKVDQSLDENGKRIVDSNTERSRVIEEELRKHGLTVRNLNQEQYDNITRLFDQLRTATNAAIAASGAVNGALSLGAVGPSEAEVEAAAKTKYEGLTRTEHQQLAYNRMTEAQDKVDPNTGANWRSIHETGAEYFAVTEEDVKSRGAKDEADYLAKEYFGKRGNEILERLGPEYKNREATEEWLTGWIKANLLSSQRGDAVSDRTAKTLASQWVESIIQHERGGFAVASNMTKFGTSKETTETLGKLRQFIEAVREYELGQDYTWSKDKERERLTRKVQTRAAGANRGKSGLQYRVADQGGTELCTDYASAAFWNSQIQDTGRTTRNFASTIDDPLTVEKPFTDKQEATAWLKQWFTQNPNSPIIWSMMAGAGRRGNHAINRASGAHTVNLIGMSEDGQYIAVGDSNGGEVYWVPIDEVYDETAGQYPVDANGKSRGLQGMHAGNTAIYAVTPKDAGLPDLSNLEVRTRSGRRPAAPLPAAGQPSAPVHDNPDYKSGDYFNGDWEKCVATSLADAMAMVTGGDVNPVEMERAIGGVHSAEAVKEYLDRQKIKYTDYENVSGNEAALERAAKEGKVILWRHGGEGENGLYSSTRSGHWTASGSYGANGEVYMANPGRNDTVNDNVHTIREIGRHDAGAIVIDSVNGVPVVGQGAPAAGGAPSPGSTTPTDGPKTVEEAFKQRQSLAQSVIGKVGNAMKSRIASGQLVFGRATAVLQDRGVLMNYRGARDDLYRYSGITDADREGYSKQGWIGKDGTASGISGFTIGQENDKKAGVVYDTQGRSKLPVHWGKGMNDALRDVMAYSRAQTRANAAEWNAKVNERKKNEAMTKTTANIGVVISMNNPRPSTQFQRELNTFRGEIAVLKKTLMNLAENQKNMR